MFFRAVMCACLAISGLGTSSCSRSSEVGESTLHVQPGKATVETTVQLDTSQHVLSVALDVDEFGRWSKGVISTIEDLLSSSEIPRFVLVNVEMHTNREPDFKVRS